MSEELSWDYRLQEEAQRRIRVSVLKDSTRSSVAKWQTVINRAEALGVMDAVTRSSGWAMLFKAVDRAASGIAAEDDEDKLASIQREVEKCTAEAIGIVQHAYEQELERQRKQALLRKALSALESLKTVIQATKANELAQRWEPTLLDALTDESKRVQGIIDAGRQGEVPGVCQEIAARVAAVVESADKKEQNYREVTEVKNKIAAALGEFGFVVTTEERRAGTDFRGYVVRAREPYSARGVETHICRDGTVRDDFVNYEGASCKEAADKYIATLKRFQVEPENLQEHYRFDPQLLTKDNIQRPAERDRNMQS